MREKYLLSTRVEKELKDSVEHLAEVNETSTSEYLRSILERECYSNPVKKLDSLNTQNQNEWTLSFSQKKEYNGLLLWLLQSKIAVYNVKRRELVKFKEYAELAFKDVTLSNQLRFEYLKVFEDLKRFLKISNEYSSGFKFNKPDNKFSFDFDLLFNELKSKF